MKKPDVFMKKMFEELKVFISNEIFVKSINWTIVLILFFFGLFVVINWFIAYHIENTSAVDTLVNILKFDNFVGGWESIVAATSSVITLALGIIALDIAIKAKETSDRTTEIMSIELSGEIWKNN